MLKVKIELTGTARLLMHNAQLSDPLNPFAKNLKSVSGKRIKTEADHEQMAKFEYMGSLYYDDAVGGLYVPGDNVMAMIGEAAKASRKKTAVQSSVIVADDFIPLISQGAPSNVDDLFADPNYVLRTSVKIKDIRVMRTRPSIPAGWTLSTHVLINDSLLNFDQFQEIVHHAGAVVGLGDWRPRYGRFTALVEKA